MGSMMGFTEEDNSEFFTTASLLRLLKLVRIQRIPRVIQQLTVTQENKAMMKLIYNLFLLVIYTHIIACSLWYIFDQ